MLIKIGVDIELSVATPMALIYLLRVHPSRRDDLVAPESLRVSGGLVPEEYIDTFGNHCGRINVPVGMPTVRITNDALIRDSGELDAIDPDARQRDPTELPFSTLQFLLPSRYCEVDSELLPFAWQQFGGIAPGWQRVAAICDFVHRHLTFDYQRARPTRTALDAFREQTGVCRDFTHLAVTLCRCMNIPARYTTGYLGDIGVPAAPYPMDFSAWFEVFLGDRWFTFDARHNERRIGRIVMARGRDAGDVPITMCFGANSLVRFDVVTEEVAEPVAAAARRAGDDSSPGDTMKKTPTKDKVQGEGDYEASRRYDKASREFAHSGRVEPAARDAAPENAREAAELAQAEQQGKSHSKGEGPLVSKRRKA